MLEERVSRMARAVFPPVAAVIEIPL